MGIIKTSIYNIFRRKNRTILTLSGIAIGIAALTLLIAILDGVYFDATTTFSEINGIFVYSSKVPDPVFGTIDKSFENTIKTIPGVKKVVPEYYKLANEINKKPLGSGFNQAVIFAVDIEDFRDSSYGNIIQNIVKGRELKPNDKGKIMVSQNLADKLNLSVGQKIELDLKKFEIVGIFNLSSNLSGEPIVMSYEDLKSNYSYPNDQVNVLYVLLTNPEQSSKIKKLIEFKSDKLKAVGKQDFMKQIEDILNNLKLLAIVVSLVAGIVAGIGVLNTMLMSVMERTAEIGTLKAVGWTKTNIIVMVLLESLFIGILGSIIGILIGYTIGSIITNVYGLTTIITLYLVIQNIILGTLIGVIGGIYPSIKAANMDPIEAIRDE